MSWNGKVCMRSEVKGYSEGSSVPIAAGYFKVVYIVVKLLLNYIWLQPFISNSFLFLFLQTWIPTPHPVLHSHSNCDHSSTDDALVARAKVRPSDGSGQGGEEEDGTARLWRTVIIGDQEHRIDMQVIRPYLRVVTHGGQCTPSSWNVRMK